jgi:hypothetical protein
MKWLFNMAKRFFIGIFKAIKNMIVDIASNIEAVVILTFSAIGLTTVLAEIPFHYAMPAFIEAAMVIPLVSILIIWTLLSIMQMRMRYAKQHI